MVYIDRHCFLLVIVLNLHIFYDYLYYFRSLVNQCHVKADFVIGLFDGLF